jgi:predicted RNA binding protein YcfA (HicA-like mRNA interferase family)
MPGTPTLRPREVIAILTALGFREIRQRGSHKRFRHPDGRTTTVPVHATRDLPPFILRQIARQARLTVREFLAHR